MGDKQPYKQKQLNFTIIPHSPVPLNIPQYGDESKKLLLNPRANRKTTQTQKQTLTNTKTREEESRTKNPSSTIKTVIQK
ncbi:MAG: hypothetical protein GX799_09030 [Crenarchaeota archaeon]|nr:hypothetical protein [Thermoproteota archaeon]